MSIILKGIDMPRKGEYLNISINNSGEVTFVHLVSLEKTDAEAIQIPKGHGRLIDGGELYKDFENYCSGECDCCVHETENYNCGLIANAPTILEEEK